MEIRRSGGQAFSTAAGEQDFLVDDPDDPSRRLIRQVLGAVNEYERAMIRLRLRRGQQREAERGGYAGGRPPYGYRAEGKALVPVAEEQEVIRLVRRLHGQGASLREISSNLEADGLKPRSGGTWHPTMLARLTASRVISPEPHAPELGRRDIPAPDVRVATARALCDLPLPVEPQGEIVAERDPPLFELAESAHLIRITGLPLELSSIDEPLEGLRPLPESPDAVAQDVADGTVRVTL